MGTLALFQWLAAPLAALFGVWATNRHNLKKEKAGRDFAFRRELYTKVLSEIVATQQLFADMIGDMPPTEKLNDHARSLGQAITSIQLVASPETVRLVHSYSLELHKYLYDMSYGGYEIAELKAAFEAQPPGRAKDGMRDRYNRMTVSRFDVLGPVLELLINHGIPPMLALRKELEIDTDGELFEQVIRQNAADGKAFIAHLGVQLKIRAGLLEGPPAVMPLPPST